MRCVHLVCLVPALLASCISLEPDTYVGYPGPTRPAEQIAVVVGRTAVIKAIDGKQVFPHPEQGKFYTHAHVRPGRHRIEAIRRFNVSVFIVPKGYVDTSMKFDLDLQAGRTYELHANRTVGHGFKVFHWVEDAATGKRVAGTKLREP